MINAVPSARDLVLIGGGHTHALLLKRWGMNPLSGVRVTLIDPVPETAYTGMLPGFIAGHYPRDALDIDLVRLARHAGASFVHGAANGIDLTARTVKVSDQPAIRYDALSIDIGVHSGLSGLGQAVSAKPLAAFAAAWAAFLKRDIEDPHVHFLGGGLAGCELALAAAHRLREKRAKISLIERSSEVLAGLSAGQRRLLLKALQDANIQVHLNREVSHLERNVLTFTDGPSVQADFVVSAAGAKPYAWLAETDLPLQDGFICVDKHLRVTGGHPTVFAVGDCAHMTCSPRPKAGVFAVRQAPVLDHNIRAILGDGKLRPYRPQKDYLKLVSLGERSCAAFKFGFAFKGRRLWALKNRIDQRFLDGLKDLPDMPALRPADVRTAGGE
ncbi:MAG: FAD-dependent oxidoreductase [Pseudomonadota bacterium]